jgi:hypothetical protein
MRRYVFALLLVIVGVLPIGCACGDGVAYSARERAEIHHRVHEMDCRMLNDDLDYLFLEEQPSRLSRWPIE